MITAKLGVGPLSKEIIEATYRFSEQHKKQMMLIASLNQINAAGGYVYGWNTRWFKEHCDRIAKAHPQADVLLCRDHCGPFFMGEPDLVDSMNKVYANLTADCEAGFDLIHIDMCHLSDNLDQVMESTNQAMHFCRSINPEVQFEVGTDAIESSATGLSKLEEALAVLEFPVEFFVINTGSLVRDYRQAGRFAIGNTQRCTDLLQDG